MNPQEFSAIQHRLHELFYAGDISLVDPDSEYHEGVMRIWFHNKETRENICEESDVLNGSFMRHTEISDERMEQLLSIVNCDWVMWRVKK